MSGMPDVEEIRSVSRFGLSAVTVVFKEHVNIYWARQQVAERLAQAREEIPAGFGTPELGPISTGLREVYQFVVRGKGYSPMELREILDWQIGLSPAFCSRRDRGVARRRICQAISSRDRSGETG